MFDAFRSSKDNKNMFKITFYQEFHNFIVNLRKNEGFLTYIPCIPIPEYGQSNSPLVKRQVFSLFLKFSTVLRLRKSCGKLFQSLGAIFETALSP